ncbi:ECF transporter S component [Microbacterium sp. 179-B 1A2 NHS]|uniref:ECF transporter S component n=1 Tax=Microbacterium sp. 179-B 1A2 NHS TaxID=3142383 RepID=UPI00399F4681
MPRHGPLSTRVLLVCAALGVATGIVGGIAGLLTPVVLIVAPFAYGLVLGSHVLPGIIAQQVFRLPLVALTTHLLAALVASAFNPAWMVRFVGTALLFGAIQEGVAALTRYRTWGAWRFFVSAVVIGGAVAVVVFLAADLGKLALWAQIVYIAISFLGPVAWTAVGLGVGASLRRAGVARRAPDPVPRAAAGR